MDKIYQITGLEELTTYICTFDKEKLYTKLEQEFKSLTEYKDAGEWNKLVRVCELLSIIGWGDLERLDAICYKAQSIWKTELRNKNKEVRFLSARWTKRKKGFVCFNPEYYYSPDIPEKQSITWENYPKREEIICDVPKLSDQQNKQKVNPIIFGGIYSLNTKIERNMLFSLLFDLRKKLDNNLNVDMYGNGIDIISTRYITAEPDEKDKTHFKKGTYYPKRAEYHAEAFFGEEYATAEESERKEIIQDLLLEILNDVKKKVLKYKLSYDIDMLITDVKKELNDWLNSDN